MGAPGLFPGAHDRANSGADPYPGSTLWLRALTRFGFPSYLWDVPNLLEGKGIGIKSTRMSVGS